MTPNSVNPTNLVRHVFGPFLLIARETDSTVRAGDDQRHDSRTT
jgi:hypothetical protein